MKRGEEAHGCGISRAAGSRGKGAASVHRFSGRIRDGKATRSRETIGRGEERGYKDGWECGSIKGFGSRASGEGSGRKTVRVQGAGTVRHRWVEAPAICGHRERDHTAKQQGQLRTASVTV